MARSDEGGGQRPGKPAVVRRTQRERTEAMKARLIDATIESIEELGYGASSIYAITARAGVSRGAVFAHFDAKVDLVIAALQATCVRLVESFAEQFLAGAPDAADDEWFLQVLQSVLRSREGTVLAELLVAARTDAELRAPFADAASVIFDDLAGTVGLLPTFARCPPDQLPGLFLTVLRLFVGSATTSAIVRADPGVDANEVTMAVRLVRSVAAPPDGTDPT